MAYVNADIILLSDFLTAIKKVMDLKRHFLMVGHRWDLDVKDLLLFEKGWEEQLRHILKEKGVLHPWTGIDYFVFPRGLWNDHILPFALGRTSWDNWLIYEARRLGAWVIDSTAMVTAIHQNHPYPQVKGGAKEAWESDEAKKNQKLASPHGFYDLRDSTHALTPRGLKRNWKGTWRLHEVKKKWEGRFNRWVWYPLLGVTRPVRHPLGLRRDKVEKYLNKLFKCKRWERRNNVA